MWWWDTSKGREKAARGGGYFGRWLAGYMKKRRAAIGSSEWQQVAAEAAEAAEIVEAKNPKRHYTPRRNEQNRGGGERDGDDYM